MKTLHKYRSHSKSHFSNSFLGTLAAGLLALGATNAPAQHFGSAFRVGSAGNDEAMGIVRDADGNLYVTGFFMETVDFDPGAGVVNLSSAGIYDAFVAKYDHDDKLVWAKRMGGADTDFAQAITLDSSGNVLITGSFQGTADFDPGAGTFNMTSAGDDDSFICKLNTNGNFVWAKRLGGADSQTGRDIKVDAQNNVVTVGEFTGLADFNPDAGTFNMIATGERDIYVSKLNANGVFLWSKRMGGNEDDQGLGLAVDTAGNVLTTGNFAATADFDPGVGVFNMTAASTDIFVSKLNASGGFVWAKRVGANAYDVGNDIAIDGSGNVVVTGEASNLFPVDFDPGAGTFFPPTGGVSSSFVLVLTSSGNFVWAKCFGGDSYALAIDSLGNILTTGRFSGTKDFDPGTSVFNLTSAGESDIFVSKLDASGNFLWAGRMGGSSYDLGYAIATDAVSANVWTAGIFSGTADFDPGNGVFNLTATGEEGIFELFVSRLTTHSKVLWSDDNGRAVIWTVDGCGDKVDSTSFAMEGFIAMSYDRASENDLGYLLWSNQQSGKAVLWLLTTSDEIKFETSFGIKEGWKAVSYRTSQDGTGKLLWENTDGSKQFWTTNEKGEFVCGIEIGGTAGWQVRSYVR